MCERPEGTGEAQYGMAAPETCACSGHRAKGMATGQASADDQPDRAAGQASQREMTPEGDMEFHLAVEVHYHRARQAFLAAAHRWAMFATILSSASAAAPLAPAVSGLIAAAFSAADIAFDFTGRAQCHGDMARRYLTLAARLMKGASQQEIFDEWLVISADEPATYRLAQIIAHNRAIKSLGRDAALERLTIWQRLRAHIWMD